MKQTGGERYVGGILMLPRKFGPFESLEAAKAAFLIMGDME